MRGRGRRASAACRIPLRRKPRRVAPTRSTRPVRAPRPDPKRRRRLPQMPPPGGLPSETFPPTAPPPRVEWTKKLLTSSEILSSGVARGDPPNGVTAIPRRGRTSRTRGGGGGKIKRLPSVDNTVMRKKAGCYIGRHEWLGFRRPGGERYSACRYCLTERSVTPRRGGGRSRDVDGADGDQPVDRGADASGARDQTSAAA